MKVGSGEYKIVIERNDFIIERNYFIIVIAGHTILLCETKDLV